MSSAILIRNAVVIDIDASTHSPKDILIEEGIISRIAEGGTLPAAEGMTLIEHHDLHLSIGWMDIGTAIHEPGNEHKETLSQLAQAAIKGGYTALVGQSYTIPVADNAQSIRAQYQRVEALPIYCYFSGSITEGAKGNELAEIYDMHQAGAPCFMEGIHHTLSSGTLLRALQYVQPFSGKLCIHANDHTLVPHAQMNEGEMAALLGMKGSPELTEYIEVEKALSLLEYTGGNLHFMACTSAQALIKIAAAKKKGRLVSVSVPIPHLYFSDRSLIDFDTNYKVYPPFRSEEQKNQLKQQIKAGEVDMLVSLHHAQSVEEKKQEFDVAEAGMLGLQTAFALANESLIQPQWLSLSQWVQMVAYHPRQWLGMPTPSIKEGERAELTLFLPHQQWVLSESEFTARARNTPLLHKPLVGKPLGVITKGCYRPA